MLPSLTVGLPKQKRAPLSTTRVFSFQGNRELFAVPATRHRHHLGQSHRDSRVTAPPDYFDIHRVADLMLIQKAVQIIVVRDFLAVDCDDNIPEFSAVFSLRQST